MVKLSLIKFKHRLLDDIGQETIIKEYKEFYLRKSINLDDIDDLMRGFINTKTKRNIYESILYYIDKYYNRYLISLTNISKSYLTDLLDETHSKFYIGVSDSGIITGVPILPDQIEPLKTDIINRILVHYKNIIGLHIEKGYDKINIGNDTYYNFNELIDIIKKHTKINLHILKKNKKHNRVCYNILELIEKTKHEEQTYLKDLKKYKTKISLKCLYNDKYSQAFYKLIRSPVIAEFKEYTSIPVDKYTKLIYILRKKIITHGDVDKYLYNGLYISGSLFNDERLDEEYGEYMRIYLKEYQIFKKIQLAKNVKVEPFIQKNPMKKLNPILKNISCFNEYLEIDYYMIEIELPFIKDKNVFIASKINDKIKILERGYIKYMDTPCTI